MATVPDIPTTRRLLDATATAAQTDFDITWPVIADSQDLALNDLVVLVDGTEIDPADFTFAGVAITGLSGIWNGGTITLDDALTGGERVIIYSDRTPRRTGSFLEGKSLPFTELDKLTDDIVIQLRDLALQVERCVKIGIVNLTDGESTELTKTIADLEAGATSIAQTVNTIPDLRALAMASANLGSVIAVLGNDSVGDGGDGLFRVTSSSPGADNDGTAIHSNTPNFYFNRLTGGSDLCLDWFGVTLGTSTGPAAANDAAIANWLGELGNGKKTGRLPAGTIVFATDIVVPASTTVRGAGRSATILKPTSAISSCAITQGAGSELSDLTIDGALTTGKRGWEIGVNVIVSSGYKKVNNGQTRRLEVKNFGGAGGAGGWIPRADAWRMEDNLWWGDNTVGFIVGPQSLSSDYQNFIPTELSFINEYYKQNDTYGLLVLGGGLLRWKYGAAQVNGDEGVYCVDTYMTSSDPMDDILFDEMQFEQNHQTWIGLGNDARDKHNVVVNISANDGRASGWRMKDCRFVSPDNAAYARPFEVQNCRDTQVIRPSYYKAASGHETAFIVNGSGDSAIFEWAASLSGDPCDMIEDNTVAGGVQITGYSRMIDVSSAMNIQAQTDASYASISAKATIRRENRLVRVTGSITFTPTWTGTPGPLLLTCSDANMRTASNRTNARRIPGNVSFDKIDKSGYSTFWAFVDPNTNVIGFMAEGNNVAPAQVNVQDLPSAAACTIYFDVEYEAKFVGTVG